MKASLLIASTDESLLDLATRLLTSCGFQVDVASTGVDCLARLREQTPDVLVLDDTLLWGGGDGILALLEEERDPWASLPVILLSERNSSAEADGWAASSVVVRRLRKPFQLSVLLEATAWAVR